MTMSPSPWFTGVLLVVLAGCVTIQPRVNAPGGPIDSGSLGPRPAPEIVGGTDTRPAIDQVCRSRARPSGYLAIAYTIEGERCPQNSDPGNPYNGATIERYRDRSVGSLMTVCADQAIPSGWVREHGRTPSGGCAGARVREGAATAVTIRRVR